jgi:hypothetical protein
MSRFLFLILIVCGQSAFGVANTDQFSVDGELVFENAEAECSVVLQKNRSEWGLGISSISHPELGAQEAQQLTDAVLKMGDQIPAGGRRMTGSYTFRPQDLHWVDKIVITTKVDPDPDKNDTVSASFSFIKVNSWFFGFSTEEVEILNCKNAKLLVEVL